MLSWLLTQGTVRHPGDHLLFHAAALCSGDDGLLLPAASRSGKSTLAAALVARGLSYLSDEVGALDASSGRLVGFPKPISLDETSLALLSGRQAQLEDRFAPWMRHEWQVPASTVRAGASARHCIPRLVVFPVRSPDEPARLRRLRPMQVLARLVEHSFNFAHGPAMHFESCAELSRATEGYELVAGDLDDAVNLLVGLLGVPHPPGTLSDVSCP